MKKEKTSIYEAISLQGDILKTAIKENASPQTAGETLPSTSEELRHSGWKGQSQVLPLSHFQRSWVRKPSEEIKMPK